MKWLTITGWHRVGDVQEWRTVHYRVDELSYIINVPFVYLADKDGSAVRLTQEELDARPEGYIWEYRGAPGVELSYRGLDRLPGVSAEDIFDALEDGDSIVMMTADDWQLPIAVPTDDE